MTRTKNPTPKKIVETYNYKDESGKLLYQVVRYEPKGFRQRQPDGRGGWIWNLKDVKRVPYKLPELLKTSKQDSTFIVEGEKDVDRFCREGIPATTCPMGAHKWRKQYNAHFHGRIVRIIPDNDNHGREHAEQIANSLYGVAAEVRIVPLPQQKNRRDIKDVSDFFDAGGETKELLELEDAAKPFEPINKGENETTDEPTRKQVDLLMDLCSNTRLFHDNFRDGYAEVPIDGHREILRLSSKSFRLWLNGRYYSHNGGVPSKQVLGDAIVALEGQAQFEAPQRTVAVRLAEHEGKLYLDLGDPDWRVVEIDGQDWRIVENSPVSFLRPSGLADLPVPIRGGSIDLLKDFVNIKDSADWALLLGWILGAYRPVGPYPLLSITGEQGSAKSTACRLIQELTDLNVAKLRSPPRSDHDLMLVARNTRVLAFDNISRISPCISDALCRLSTGGAFSTRKLYSDDEETILAAQRPVILNGIVEASNRSDLLDRTICLSLVPISDQDRRTERELQGNFLKVKPRILGALLDGVSSALRDFDNVQLSNPPRMADFAHWAAAGLPGLGLSQEDFLTAYASNRLEANQLALEGNLVAEALQSFLANRPYWEGTATRLLEKLDELPETEKHRKRKGWPKGAAKLGEELRRLAPNLRRIDIDINFDRSSDKGRARMIEIAAPDYIAANMGKDPNVAEY